MKHQRTGQSMDELYVFTILKKTSIKALGYKYVTKWDHKFQQQIKATPALKKMIMSQPITTRLNPRDSFFGGRVNAARLHHKITDDESIQYVDFTSLYPAVNKYDKYPVGHPDIIVNDFKTIDKYFGIAQVSVLPPRGLFHPVLPYRSGNKLLFPLCRTCADTLPENDCQCTDSDRTIHGTYCTPELEKAVQMGYIITCIHEVYHWDTTTQYNPESMKDGLFSGYINLFLTLKQQASGWPDNIPKQKYIEDMLTKEGLTLDPASIEVNPALRSLAKLLLNSLWGKFAQGDNKPQSTFIDGENLDKFYQLMFSDSINVKNFQIINESLIHVQWDHKDHSVPDSKTSNIFLATFTTCWARLRLYTILQMVGERALYYDTDSMIYVNKPGLSAPPVGQLLGELKSELREGEFITEFVSGGPKNYAYLTNLGAEECKVKGFTLNYTNAQKIHFNTIKDMILSQKPLEQRITTTNPTQITRQKDHSYVYNTSQNKTYKLVYTKRKVNWQTYHTLPYGY